MRPYPRFELGHLERLGKIVVGAAVESGDARVDRIVRGQDDDGDRTAPSPQLAQDLEPAQLRQGEVEEDRDLTRPGPAGMPAERGRSRVSGAAPWSGRQG